MTLNEENDNGDRVCFCLGRTLESAGQEQIVRIGGDQPASVFEQAVSSMIKS